MHGFQTCGYKNNYALHLVLNGKAIYLDIPMMTASDPTRRAFNGSISGRGVPKKGFAGDEEDWSLEFGQQVSCSVISSMMSPRKCYEVRVKIGQKLQRAFMITSRKYSAGSTAPAVFVKKIGAGLALLCAPGLERWVNSNDYPALDNEPSNNY